MIILRGKHKGQKFTIHQFCNDWFTVDEVGEVFAITNAKFTRDELDLLISKKQTAGFMFNLFKPSYRDFRFHRIGTRR